MQNYCPRSLTRDPTCYFMLHNRILGFEIAYFIIHIHNDISIYITIREHVCTKEIVKGNLHNTVNK